MRRIQSVAIVLSLLLVAMNLVVGSNLVGNEISDEDPQLPVAGGNPTPVQSPPLPSTIRLWEAWAKGWATVEQADAGVYMVTNTGPADIIIDEYIMVMSPSPSNPSEDQPGIDDETQDGILTTINTIPSGSSLIFNYGLYVTYGIEPPPPWWCTEDTELTNPGIEITMGGEILPYSMVPGVAYPDNNTQDDLWLYMRTNPSLVVGKLPLWKEIANIGDEVDIVLDVTNIGFVEATNVVVTDTIPAGYSYDPSSFTHIPSSITTNPDGTTTLKWSISAIDAAVETDINEPTDYTTVYIGYKLITPELAPNLRVFLPRAYVDEDDDGDDDAESEEPLLETYFVNRPPVALADDVAILEGETAILDGSASYDPDEPYGDSIDIYEWDLDDDGIADEYGATVGLPYGDNGDYTVTLKVTDIFGAYSTTEVVITVQNVLEIMSINATVQENAPRTQGYWKHQCTVTSPYGDHTGILQEWIDEIAAQSEVFPDVSTKDEVCAILSPDDKSNMLLKARLQLMALWLNVVSGKLSMGTELDLPGLTSSTTVGEAIAEIESIILTSSDKDELERAKDIADSINNGIGVPSKLAVLTATVSDPGSDDLTFNWSIGEVNIYFNDGVGPDPFPSPWGTYPFEISDTISYPYSGPGTITLTVTDDDGGSITTTIELP